MDNNVKSAIEDISLIKSVIEKTQKDFSKVSGFFICIGGVNLILFIIEQFAYYLRNINGYNFASYNISAFIVQMFSLVAYIICYIIYYRIMKSNNNDISMGMLKIWGIVLIGSQLFLKIYIGMLPDINNIVVNILFRCKELILILPVIFALFMTGILTKKRLITYVTTIISLVYLFLFVNMAEMRYGTIGGVGTRLPISSVFIKFILVFGMIALGLYLRKGAKDYGDKFNT